MKKILFLLSFCLVAFSAAHAQQAANKAAVANAGKFNWTKGKDHDFGKIPQGTPVNWEFEFTNAGKAPIVLSSVSASCGCTTPEWTKEAVAPGKTGKIKVQFNAAAVGTFTKTITVVSNAEEANVVLTIKGEVQAPQSGKTGK
jgi:hypothetical protein